MIVQQAAGAVQVLAGVVPRGGAAAAAGDVAPRAVGLRATGRAGRRADAAEVVAVDVAHPRAAVAYDDDRAVEGVVLLDRPGAGFLPQPAQVHGRGAASRAGEPLAVGVVAVR